VRIAALTTIGAHVSPEIAVNGFHSQAGWVTFLIIALAIMIFAFPLVSRREAALAKPALPQRFVETSTYLVPFIAMMVGTTAMAVTAPHHNPVYVLKVALTALALWSIREHYAVWRPALSVPGVAVGVAVGVAWMATAPAAEATSPLADWLVSIGPVWAALWLVMRGLGSIILVPIAEELAFRGYLYRRIISRDFYEVDPKALSWIALAASSILFGLLHDRLVAGTLAGVAFALVMLRTGRLSDAITAHVVANAVIFASALAFGWWSLL
ncbi:MAG: exosortase E/protease, VPEID-CTERM system, partial [Alphaproteobacteria bacterium]|nr:exosortase E/protease, VPEID-CTERM system [Alphaproteobacteria bacterium]